jgi:hypothetical protein
MSQLSNSAFLPASSTVAGTMVLPTANTSGLTSIGSNYIANSNGYSTISGNGASLDTQLKSIRNRLAMMEERLAILTPDLQKLEKYTALKKAYDNYKVVENLCKDLP